MILQLSVIIRKYRVANGLTQQDVSDYLKLKLSTYQKYEENRSEPSIHTLLKLTELYNVSLDDFLYDRHIPRTNDEKLLSKYKASPDFVRRTINMLLNFPDC